MKKMRAGAALALVVSAVLWSAPAVAGGFSQGFQGASSAGLSGAMTARPDVPEAGYFNPAGFAIQDKWGVGGGASVLIPFVNHVDPRTQARTQAEINGAFPPNLHGYGRLGNFAAGLSLGVPYGSGLQWPDDWDGRFEVTATRLTAMEAAPSVAWRPVEWLAIGAGPRLTWATVGFARQIDTARPGEEARVNLDADAFGLGAQVGVWARPFDAVSFGVSWRSAVRLDFEGVARFENVPPEMEHRAHDTVGRTTMTLPDRIAFGVAYELSAYGVVSLDFEYNRWSVIDTFEVRFERTNGEGPDDILEPRDWENTLSMRLGIEYLSPIGGLALRSGFAIDPSPAPAATLTPATPDMDRFIMSLGAGYTAIPNVEIDVAYNYVVLSETASTGDFAGVYDGQIHVFSLGFRL